MVIPAVSAVPSVGLIPTSPISIGMHPGLAPVVVVGRVVHIADYGPRASGSISVFGAVVAHVLVLDSFLVAAVESRLVAFAVCLGVGPGVASVKITVGALAAAGSQQGSKR